MAKDDAARTLVTPAERNWILTAAGEASEAKHCWPRMAACEAALESNFGQSMLARQANNLFGTKQHVHATYGTLVLPTREWENSQWIVTTADWVKYPDIQTCFLDRMATLYRLAPVYPHYEAALAAATAEDYVVAVSQTWSTDPQRASKCVSIYNEAFPPTDPPSTT